MSNKREKPYKRGDKLTKQQEIFCEEVAKGNTQTDAYLIAYPKSKNWQREGVWVQASELVKKEKIKRRIEQLKEDTQEDVNWTRKKVLSTLNYAINKSKDNIVRKENIYEDMIQDKYEELMQWVNLLNIENINIKGVNKNIKRLKNTINELELQKEASSSNIKGILSTIQIINRMQRIRFNKTTRRRKHR